MILQALETLPSSSASCSRESFLLVLWKSVVFWVLRIVGGLSITNLPRRPGWLRTDLTPCVVEAGSSQLSENYETSSGREHLLGTQEGALVAPLGQREEAHHRHPDRRRHARHREGERIPLKGVLPKDYARPALNKVMLGELIDLISGIALGEEGAKSKDILGRVYEYFLGQFAGAEGKRGGEFYTPRSVVRVLVEML